MDIIICHCLKCETELGRFRNAWNGIGNTYFSPVHKLVSADGLETTGDVFEAARGSSIEFCLLRDVVCANCRVVLGLRCDSAPEDHILKQDQLILRLKETYITCEGSGKTASASVLKTIPLKDDKKVITPNPCRASSVQPSFHPFVSFHSSAHKFPDDSDTVNEWHNSRRYSVPTEPLEEGTVSEMEIFATRVEKFKDWAEHIMGSQQIDIDRISGTVFRIEREMQMVKDLMQQISSNFSTSHHKLDYNTELSEMKKEIKFINERLERIEETPEWNKTASLLARNLKTVASDVKNLAAHTSEIQDLKFTLEVLSGRLHHLEAQEQVSTSIKCTAYTKDKYNEPLSRKRNHDLTKMSFKEQQDAAKLSQIHVKKRCLDEVHNVRNLSNINNSKSDEIGLHSSIIDQYDNNFQTNDQIPAQKNSSHLTPQVLICGSNFKTSSQEPKKKFESLYPDARKISSPDHRELADNEDSLPYMNRHGSDTAIQNSNTESEPKISVDNVDGENSVDLNHHEKPNDRFLRKRKTKSTKKSDQIIQSRGTDKTHTKKSLGQSEDHSLHLSESDSIVVSENSLTSEPKPYPTLKCGKCEKTFKSPQALQNHKSKFQTCFDSEFLTSQSFTCNACTKRFTSAEKLANHLKRTNCVYLPPASESKSNDQKVPEPVFSTQTTSKLSSHISPKT